MSTLRDRADALRTELESLPPQTYYRDVGTIPNPRMDDNLYSASKSGEIGVEAAEIALEAADDVFFSAQQAAASANSASASASASASTAAQQAGIAKNEADRAEVIASTLEISGDIADLAGTIAALPKTKPTLNLDFINQKQLLPMVEFTRASKDWDSQGREYGINEPVLTEDGLWVSGARTNYALWSEDLTNSVWVKKDIEAVELKTVDGIQFSKITPNSNDTWHYARQNVSLPEGEQSYQFKIIKDGIRYLRFTFRNTSGTQSHFYADLDGLTVIPNNEVSSYSITEDGGVIEIKLTVEGAANNNFDFIPTLYPNTVNMSGNGVDGTWVGGFMAEPTSDNTTYIPTEGSQVTVAATRTSIDLSDVGPEFSILVEYRAKNMKTQQRAASLTSSSGYSELIASNATGQWGGVWAIRPSGGSFVNVGAIIIPSAQNVETVALSLSSLKALVSNRDGLGETMLSNSIGTPSKISLGASRYYDLNMTGRISKIQLYNQALTPAQLQELTS